MNRKLPSRRENDELIAFLPRLTADGFAPVREWGGGENQADGAYVMPWPVYDEVVGELLERLAQLRATAIRCATDKER